MKNSLALFIIALVISSIACSITYEASFKSMTDSVDAVKKSVQNMEKIAKTEPQSFQGEVLEQEANKNNQKENDAYFPAHRKIDENNKEDIKNRKEDTPKFASEDLAKMMNDKNLVDKDDNPTHMHNNKKFVEIKTRIDKLEDDEEKLKEQDIKPESRKELSDLKEKLQKVIEEHNEKYQPEGLNLKNEKQSLESMTRRSERHAKLAEQNLSEENIQAELEKDSDKDEPVLSKRLVPSQASFDNGSMMKSVYGAYKMPQRAWYYAQQFNIWTYAYRYNRNIWNRNFRLPMAMKELEISFEFNFIVMSARWHYSSHACSMVSFVMDRMKMKEVSITDTSQYDYRGRWLVERYTLTAKLFNVPSGDHQFKLYFRSGNGHYQYINYAGFYSPYDKKSKLMMIGYPEK